MYKEIKEIIKMVKIINDFEELKIMYIDYVIDAIDEKNYYDVDVTNNNDYYKSVTLKPFIQNFQKNDIKTDNVLDLYDIILDKYYSLSLKNETSKVNFEYDLNQNINHSGNMKLKNLATKLCNEIVQKSRYPTNLVIIPSKEYEFLFPQLNIKKVINKSNKYKDKIFIIAINQDNNSPGLTLLYDDSIQTKRYYKIKQLMNKVNNKQIEEIKINYILTEIGTNNEKFIRCINF